MADHNTLSGRLWNAKRDARNRGIAFELTDEQAVELFQSDCYWCGAAPSPLNGIDRLGNELYYRAESAVPCCWPCNEAKKTRTARGFLDFVEQVFMWQYRDSYPGDVDDIHD